jgi:hypothetical protein
MADLQPQKYPGAILDSTSRIKNTKPNNTTNQQVKQTKKTLKHKIGPSTGTKIATPATQKKQSMFLPTSRLNRGQRKYCHCLMSVRTPKQSPYGICSLQSYRTMKANPGQRAFRFIPRKTNCIMNYDYTQYSLEDVQNLAVERGIPLSNPKTGKQNNKTTLVQLLTNRYITKHRSRKSKPE